jgi:hypothetical protein
MTDQVTYIISHLILSLDALRTEEILKGLLFFPAQLVSHPMIKSSGLTYRLILLN